MADQLERDMLEAMRNSAAASVPEAVIQQEEQRSREMIARLRDTDMPGRIVIKLDVPEALEKTPWDMELEDGDMLRVPENPATVEVMGAVYTSSAQVYNPRMGIADYINASGGYLRSAHKRMIYLMKSDGTIIRLTRRTDMLSSKQWTPPKGFSATVEPGDVIVAPMKHTDRQAIETYRDLIDIIYKVAISVGVILQI